MNSVRLGIVIIAAGATACAPKPTGGSASSSGGGGPSSSSSSGGSSSGWVSDGGAIPLEHYCDETAASWCVENPCDPTLDIERCKSAQRAGCQQYVDSIVASGAATYDGIAARDCLAQIHRIEEVLAMAECEPTPATTAAINETRFGVTSCSPAGTGVVTDPFDVCRHVFAGSKPAAASCSQAAECAGVDATGSGVCPPPGDGGCGTCATPRIVAVGETCIVSFAGGYRMLNPCADNAVCDQTTKKCVPQRAIGEPCGAGVAACADGCGEYCSRAHDGDGGTCARYADEEEPCDYSGFNGWKWCKFGLSCVAGTCQRQVTVVGAPCSNGAPDVDAMTDPPYNRRGTAGWSYPTCAYPLTCEVADAGVFGRGDGICQPVEFVATGAECNDLYKLCRGRDYCPVLDGGTRICSHSEKCWDYRQCPYGMWCHRSGGQQGVCEEQVSLGQPCSTPEQCTGWVPITGSSTCHEGTCVAAEQVLTPIPTCQ